MVKKGQQEKKAEKVARQEKKVKQEKMGKQGKMEAPLKKKRSERYAIKTKKRFEAAADKNLGII